MNQTEKRLRRLENALGLAPMNAETIEKVGIVVGHSRRGDDGAVSVDGTSEYNYNCVVADDLQDLLTVPTHVISEVPADSYGAAMSWVAAELRKADCTLALELHFNASGTGAAQGFEYLYWGASPEGYRLAANLLDAHCASRPADKNRNTKAKESGDRGAHFLSKTHCPAVIAEPFFGDNPEEWLTYEHRQAELAQIYAAGINLYLAGL